jgi:alanine racemase
VAPDLVHPGEFIDLIDDDLSIDVVGAAAGTTAYEVLTALSRRSLRRYIGGQL